MEFRLKILSGIRILRLCEKLTRGLLFHGRNWRKMELESAMKWLSNPMKKSVA